MQPCRVMKTRADSNAEVGCLGGWFGRGPTPKCENRHMNKANPWGSVSNLRTQLTPTQTKRHAITYCQHIHWAHRIIDTSAEMDGTRTAKDSRRHNINTDTDTLTGEHRFQTSRADESDEARLTTTRLTRNTTARK